MPIIQHMGLFHSRNPKQYLQGNAQYPHCLLHPLILYRFQAPNLNQVESYLKLLCASEY